MRADDRLLTAREVGEWLGFSPGTILDWFERGEIPGLKLRNGRVRFPEGDVEAWLEEGRRGPRVEQLAAAAAGQPSGRTRRFSAVDDHGEKGAPSA